MAKNVGKLAEAAGASDQVNVVDRIARQPAGDQMSHLFSHRTDHGKDLFFLLRTLFQRFRFGKRHAQGAREYQGHMVASGRLIGAENHVAVAQNADPGCPAAHINHRAVANV